MFDYGDGIVLATDDHYKLWPAEGNFTALIDGDLLPYIVGYCREPILDVIARQSVADGRYPCVEETPQFLEAADHLNCMLNEWVQDSGADSARVFITNSANNYRLKVAFTKPYKGQRKSEKPPFFYELKQYLVDKHNAVIADGNEADDLIVTALWEEHRELIAEGVEIGSEVHKNFAKRIAVSTDKDLRICPGWHYDPGKRERHWVLPLGDLTPEYKKTPSGGLGIDKLRGTGLRFFYAQLLMGDAADNYPGIPRCGPGKAYELLHTCTSEAELFDTVLKQYEAKYGKAAERPNYRGGSLPLTAWQMMLEQARLAWMQTYPGELWHRGHLVPSGEDYAWRLS